MLDFLVDSYIVVWILVRLLLSEPRDIKSSITSHLSSVLGWCLIYLIVYIPEADPLDWIELNWLTDWLTNCLYQMIWLTELTALTELIYQADCLIGRTSEQWYWYQSDLNWLSWTEDPSRMMAWLNDIPGSSSQPCKEKEPEWIE